MSAFRHLLAPLHPSGKCDGCDQERDDRYDDERADEHEPAQDDRPTT